MSKRTKRKWGSPKQRRALAKMLAAGRRARRGGKSRKPRRRSSPAAPKEITVAKKRKGKRRGSSRRSIVRRTARSGGGRPGFVPVGTPMSVAAVTAGMVLPDLVLSKIPLPASLQSPMAKLGVKAAAILGIGYFGRRFLGKGPAAAFIFGGLAGIAAPFVRAKLGLNGLGYIGNPDGVSTLGGRQYGQVQGPDGTVYQVSAA